MKKIILLFVVAFVCVFSTGDLFAKGKVKVDKALEHAARQYLYMRDELKELTSSLKRMTSICSA